MHDHAPSVADASPEFWHWRDRSEDAVGKTLGADPVAVEAAHAATPYLHLWRSEIRNDAVARLPAQPERLLVYFPGTGRLDVETSDGVLTCDEVRGLCAPVSAVRRVRKRAGRIGSGLTVAQDRLYHRLSHLLQRPLHKPLAFEKQFTIADGASAPAEALIAAMLEPNLILSLRRSPTAVSALASALIDVLLESLPHNYSHVIGALRAPALPRHIRRALEIIEAAQDPTTLNTADLARRCGVSVRTLQYGFRAFLDQSPASYARNLRLARARTDIQADPERPLLQIARRWGFANPTRFKRAFIQAFGLSPADVRTLAINRLPPSSEVAGSGAAPSIWP